LIDQNHRITTYILLFSLPLIAINSYISVTQARSEWEIRAEAQFEFAKFIDRLQNELELKNPEKFADYKNVILQLLPDFRRTVDSLDPVVKLEFCKLASTSSNFPLDCNSMDQQLPLPTPLIDQEQSPSDPCLASQTEGYLTTLEINTLKINCEEKKISNITNLEGQAKDQLSERAKERMNVGCSALLLLSNTTQYMLKSLNKDASSCYSDVSAS
jgi:type II secretory pathway component PulL